MNINDAFSILESTDFQIETNLANSLAQFKTILGKKSEVTFLISTASSSEIFQRIHDLDIQEPKNDLYQHSKDAAIASYIWVLAHENATGLNGLVSTYVESDDYWWAKKLSREIRDKYLNQSASTITEEPVYKMKAKKIPNIKNVLTVNKGVFANPGSAVQLEQKAA